MRRFVVVLILVLIACLLTLTALLKRERAERGRLSDNQRTLLSDVEFYRTRDSLSAAGVERLQFTNREFERHCGTLKKEVEALQVKVGRLQSVAQTGVKTEYIVQTVVRDSIRGHADTLRCLSFSNSYLEMDGCLHGAQFTGHIATCDTLIQVVHRVPRRFWFIRWGTKAIRQEIVSKNPYSRITYSRYIEIR